MTWTALLTTSAGRFAPLGVSPVVLPCSEQAPERASELPLTAIPLDAKGYSEHNRGGDRDAQEPAGKNGPAHRHNQDGTGCNPKQW